MFENTKYIKTDQFFFTAAGQTKITAQILLTVIQWDNDFSQSLFVHKKTLSSSKGQGYKYVASKLIFCFFVKWQNNLHGLFNIKAIPVEQL